MAYTLSVVIPNYNNSRFLPFCVESIVNQSYDDILEIIIVDDCSTDNSREIILELVAKYPVVNPVFLDVNGKVSAARNVGLKIAKGEYITFVDADDSYYNIDKLKNEMALIKNYRDKGKDIVAYSSIVWMSNDGRDVCVPTIAESKYLIGNIYDSIIIDFKSSLNMRDYCVKTSILREIGGYIPEHTLFEDYELILKIAKKYEFYYTGDTGTAYRNSINGLSKAKSAQESRKSKSKIAVAQIMTEPFWNRMRLMIMHKSANFVKNIYFFIKERTQKTEKTSL